MAQVVITKVARPSRIDKVIKADSSYSLSLNEVKDSRNFPIIISSNR